MYSNYIDYNTHLKAPVKKAPPKNMITIRVNTPNVSKKDSCSAEVTTAIMKKNAKIAIMPNKTDAPIYIRFL